MLVQPPTRSRPQFTVLAVAALLAVLAVATWRTARHLHRLDNGQSGRWGMVDFRDVIYFPTRAVMEGVNPYDAEVTADPARYRGRYAVGNVFPLYTPLLMLLDWPFQ